MVVRFLKQTMDSIPQRLLHIDSLFVTSMYQLIPHFDVIPTTYLYYTATFSGLGLTVRQRYLYWWQSVVMVFEVRSPVGSGSCPNEAAQSLKLQVCGSYSTQLYIVFLFEF
jgi:hypothetical protein